MESKERKHHAYEAVAFAMAVNKARGRFGSEDAKYRPTRDEALAAAQVLATHRLANAVEANLSWKGDE